MTSAFALLALTTSAAKSTWPDSVLAQVVVHPHDHHRLGLQAVADVIGDLGHAHLLPERGAEDVRVAHLGNVGRLGARELRHLGLLGEDHVHFHRTGEHRPEDHVGVAVDRLLHLGARDAGVALRVRLRRGYLAPEDAALRVDLVDREDRTVAEVGAGHRPRAGQLDDDGHVDRLLRVRRAGGHAEGCGKGCDSNSLVHGLLLLTVGLRDESLPVISRSWHGCRVR